MKSAVTIGIEWFRFSKLQLDLPQMMEIEQLCYGQRAWTLQTMEQVLYEPRTQVRVAVDPSFRMAGYLIVRPGESRGPYGPTFRWLEIANLAVHPSCWKQGVARALVADRMKWAVSRGLDAVAANVLSVNPACDFFRKVGFRAQRVLRDRYSIGVIRFVVRLTDRPLQLD